jgi:hypothetical protein
MAVLKDMSKGWIPGIMVGVGVTLAAPIILPVLGAALRPLAKSVIKGGMAVGDRIKEVTAEAREQFDDLVAEVKAEHAAPPAAAEQSVATSVYPTAGVE